MSERLTQVKVIHDREYGGYQAGEIGKTKEGLWVIACPICNSLGELRNHLVAENEDGTITVSPSLICNGTIYDGSQTEPRRMYRPCTAHYFIERNQIRWC